MGYYTQYDLELGSNERLDRDGIAEKFEDISGFSMHSIDDESMKWYDYDTDMQKLSKEYPEVLFIMTGIGEESDDNWRHYFRGGKSHKVDAIVAYPPFDETELS